RHAKNRVMVGATSPLLVVLLLAAPDAGAPDAAATGDGGAAPRGTMAPSQRANARSEHEQAMERLKDGRIEEAAELFSSAPSHDPGNAGYATDLGFALGRLGRRAEA